MSYRSLQSFTVIAGLLFFRSDAKASTPEEDFWKWFQKHESSLFEFEKDQESTFDRLGEQMHKVSPDLTFEFGPKQNGRREFVISAGGIREAFPAVEALYSAAPKLPRWIFVKFRPRREPADISFGGITVKASSVRIKVVKNGGKVDLKVYMPGYERMQHTAYGSIMYLMLDQALGEYDVETRVGAISLQAPQNAEQLGCTLADLPRVVDSLLSEP